MFHLISLFTILFYSLKKKIKTLAPYGLTQRYPAGMLCFNNNSAKRYYPYNNPETSSFLSSAMLHITKLLSKKKSILPCMLHFYFCLPSPSVLLGTTYHLVQGHSTQNQVIGTAGEDACTCKSPSGLGLHKSEAGPQYQSEHSDRPIQDLAPTFCRAPSHCAVSCWAVLIEQPSLWPTSAQFCASGFPYCHTPFHMVGLLPLSKN